MNTTALDVPVKSVETVWVRRFAKCAAVFVAALALAWPCAAAERKETIVILLDASGSMKAVFPGSPGTRIDAAKNAIKTVVRKVPQSTEIGLLVFSAKNLKDDWAFPLGPRDDARMFATLDSIECHTDTPLGKYLNTRSASLRANCWNSSRVVMRAVCRSPWTAGKRFSKTTRRREGQVNQ